VQADAASRLRRASGGDELREQILAVAGSPNQSSRAWVTDQYDRYVQGNTVLAPPDDAGVIRVDERTGLGIALATDSNGRYAHLDPYTGAQLALAEAYRNVATSGARPLAVTDCLNFGSPEDPAVMWQFAEAVRGLADGCQDLGLPVTGGNVSLYNQTGDAPILPTPVVGVLGVLDDVHRRVPGGFASSGHGIYLLGQIRDELDGSAWAEVVHGHLGGHPPTVDLAAEQALAGLLHQCSRDGLIDTAHDLSDGGLIQALVESCVRAGHGARIWLPDGADPTVFCFAESQARAIVTVSDTAQARFVELCAAHGVAHQAIGEVDDAAPGAALHLTGLLSIEVAELARAHDSTLPAAFAG